MKRILQRQAELLSRLRQNVKRDTPQSGVDQPSTQQPQIVIQGDSFDQPEMRPSAAIPGDSTRVAEELKRVDADLRKGLLDKTGDGANANIIKLGEKLKALADNLKAVIKSPAVTTPGGLAGMGGRSIDYDSERLTAMRAQGEKYIPGMRESLGLGGGRFSNLKNLLVGDPLKDLRLEDIDERSLFGGILKRRKAERQYAEDQLAMAKTLKGDLRADVTRKKEYQDESGQFSEQIFKEKKIERFREQNRVRREIGEITEQIDRLKHDEGYTDEQIKKTGLYRKLQSQEKELSKLDPDRFAKEIQEAKKKDLEKALGSASEKITQDLSHETLTKSDIKGKVASAAFSTIDPTLHMSDPLNVNEKEAEYERIVAGQTQLLQKIEEHTRPIKDLAASVKNALGKPSERDISGAADVIKSGVGLGGLASIGLAGTALGGAAKAIKGGIRGAVSIAAKGARGILPFAGPAALAYGAANVIDYGASVLGVGGNEDQDMPIDENRDDANWQKMSLGQKIGSGFARGIESVGEFIGFSNIAKQAKVERIAKETEMLGSQIEQIQSRDLTTRQNDEQKGIQPQDLIAMRDIGGQVYQESDELKSAERKVSTQSQPNVISAPTTNINQTTQNVTRIPARNNESTYREYSRSRFGF